MALISYTVTALLIRAFVLAFTKIRFSHDTAHIAVMVSENLKLFKHYSREMPPTDYMSLIVRKPVFGVFDKVRHKPGCTATADV